MVAKRVQYAALPYRLAVAKLIIELAKQGERDPERLCASALQLSK
jgi:hypothetical protein